MSDPLRELDQQVKQRLGAAEDRRRDRRQSVSASMQRLVARQRLFDETAERVNSTVVTPRVSRIAEHFSNARLRIEPHQCVGVFKPTERFPTSATLEVSAGYDESMEHFVLGYHLRIIPIFFRFTGHDEVALPLVEVDDNALAVWLDARLVGFVEDYLKLETLDQYQHDNRVVDPVCGMTINRADAAETSEYGGIVYHFCVRGCYLKFTESPERYASTHRASLSGG